MKSHKISLAWINGEFKSSADIMVPVLDLGLQYGYGFFETLKVNCGNICFLDEHIQRFHYTWLALFNSDFPELEWKTIINKLIQENGLQEQCAAVKIMASYGIISEDKHKPNVIFTVRPYRHRLNEINSNKIKLVNYPFKRQTPLANYKTLNYLYYYMAGMWARQRNYHEALILNPDDSISETNSANILIIKDDKIVCPQSEAVLAGIMEQIVLKRLVEKGYVVEKRKIWPGELLEINQVMLTNSLFGIVPVESLDGRTLPCEYLSLCDQINLELESL